MSIIIDMFSFKCLLLSFLFSHFLIDLAFHKSKFHDNLSHIHLAMHVLL